MSIQISCMYIPTHIHNFADESILAEFKGRANIQYSTVTKGYCSVDGLLSLMLA